MILQSLRYEDEEVNVLPSGAVVLMCFMCNRSYEWKIVLRIKINDRGMQVFNMTRQCIEYIDTKTNSSLANVCAYSQLVLQ
jgi:hypothetical protein